MKLVEQIQRWPLTRLSPYAHNARIHSAEQVAQIAESIKTFGFNNPILVDAQGGIIAGHGRFAAATKLGLTEAPVILLDHLTDRERRAYIIADNKLAENATWDDAVLAAELAALNEEEFDLGILGFDDRELETLLVDDEPEAPEHDGPAPQFERLAELQAKWNTERGQVWTFGKGHRLLCGDSTRAADVERLMDGKRADLLFTSPPYANQRTYITGGSNDWDVLMNGAFQWVRMTDTGQILVNLGLVHREGEWLNYWDGWLEKMRAYEWRRFGWYVWHQGPGMPGDWNGRLAPSHEFIFHFNRESRRAHKILECKMAGIIHGSTGQRQADGTINRYSAANEPIQPWKIPDSIITIPRATGVVQRVQAGMTVQHPATFPVALPAFLMRAWTDAGQVCYEPFAGSGTQFIAGEQLERPVYGMEIAPEYCAVILERMAEAGMTPIRA